MHSCARSLCKIYISRIRYLVQRAFIDNRLGNWVILAHHVSYMLCDASLCHMLLCDYWLLQLHFLGSACVYSVYLIIGYHIYHECWKNVYWWHICQMSDNRHNNTVTIISPGMRNFICMYSSNIFFTFIQGRHDMTEFEERS